MKQKGKKERKEADIIGEMKVGSIETNKRRKGMGKGYKWNE